MVNTDRGYIDDIVQFFCFVGMLVEGKVWASENSPHPLPVVAAAILQDKEIAPLGGGVPIELTY